MRNGLFFQVLFFIITLFIPFENNGYYKRFNQIKKSKEKPIVELNIETLYTDIIGKKIDIYRGGTWYSPLIQALDTNNRQAAICLLHFGANPCCKYKNITPLKWAIEHNDYELAYLLLKSDARFSTSEVEYAKQFNKNKDIVSLLSYVLECRSKGKRALSRRDKYGLARIHYAAYQANKPLFDALILSDVSISLLDQQNNKPLYYAQLSNNVSFIEYIKKQYHADEIIHEQHA